MTSYFNKILIANRGEIAVRIIRTCRELGIATVAIYSEADQAALHVRLADEAYLIGPAQASASYLNVKRMIEIALRSGAEAIHPGYGFLSEQAHFAQACRNAGIVFIGPPPKAIELLGSKVAAKRLAEQSGVPTAPSYMGDDQSDARFLEEAGKIGFPLLIKASAGGGGKGMRVITSIDELVGALESARREARAAFGDDTMFLERLIKHPRHVEIQIFADIQANYVHLFERECSIQRRHQKIIEESPSPALNPDLRAAMGAAAVRLARAANYLNAGTVEFLLDDTGDFYFLEINTRLQVEHPVTEAITGLDLVRLQIAVAAGASLPFGQEDLLQRGHAIEARLYAEDPVTFLPSTGRVALFAVPEGAGVRVDAGIQSGDEVTVHYDPLLAKVIVYAADRAAAIARLRRALNECVVLGITTNLPLLQAIAAHPEFAAGATTTDFLTETDLGVAAVQQDLPAEMWIAVALFEAGHSSTGDNYDPWNAGAWRLNGRIYRFLAEGKEQIVGLYRNGAQWQAEISGAIYSCLVIDSSPDALTLGFGQQIERFRMTREGNRILVAWRGVLAQMEHPTGLSIDRIGARQMHGHASLESPMPGTIVKILVEAGQHVQAHQPLVVLEAMKMEHVVSAPYDGIVRRIAYVVGTLVSKGATLIDLDEI